MFRRISRILGSVFALALCAGVLFAAPALAQAPGAEPIASGFSAFTEAAGFTTQASLVEIVARLIRTVISLVGIVAVVFVLYGGFLYMTAGGDESRVKTAKRVLRNAVIGLVLVFASFAIASFAIGAISGATGTTGGIAGGGDQGGCIGCGDGHATPRHFRLDSWNQACGGLMLNTQLQFTFSEAVSTGWIGQSDPAAAGIEVKDSQGVAVAGTFKARGATITFTPSANCPGPVPGPGSEKCFPAAATYTVAFKPTILKSATGKTLECGGPFTECSVSFSTGSAIDVGRPTVAMTLPSAASASAVVGDMVPLQARVQDDVGGALASFFATDASRPVFDAGLSNSTVGSVVEDNYFGTDADHWNTVGYAPQTYQIWAEAVDCAGHTAVSPKIAFALTSAQCADGVKNGTETDIDCGGPRGAGYCGACGGGACTTAADCSAAAPTCKDGMCVSTPRIDRVSPGDGAPGNLVTITGAGFGTTAGSVVFLGEADPADDVVAQAFAQCSANWTQTQAVIQVPPGAKSGPLELRAAIYEADKTKADRTNDVFGARLSDFNVNTVVRPGLCPANPDNGVGGINVILSGLNFGATRGQGSVYFGDYAAEAYAAWANTSATVTSPRLDARTYEIQLFTGGTFCKGTSDACTDHTGCVSGVPCESTRQGSNTVSFKASGIIDQTPPAIVSIESGWKACSDNSGIGKAGLHCVADAECGTGTCAPASTWGPVGQYITITGTHFGSSGTVRFTDTSGAGILGDVDFPAACGTEFWSENSVIVKVPEMGSGKVSVTLEATGGVSNARDFQVLDGQPGPGICRVDPASGPVATLVTLYGEALTGDLRGIFFNNKIDAAPQPAGPESMTTVVPAGALTGPMFLERTTPSVFRSNSVPFAVGSCTDNAALCSAGKQCCADGTCAEVCPITNRASHYAYRFSTGPILQAPRVVVACNANVKSPTPWEGWSKPETVCLNAVVQAEFDRDMDKATLNDQNIKVQRCNGPIANPCGTSTAPTLDAPMSGGVSFTDRSIQWQPPASGGLLPDTNYQATLVGANIRSKSNPVSGVELGHEPMGQDYVWRFRTTGAGGDSATGPCAVGALAVAPSEFTVADLPHAPVSYNARPIAAGDSCIVLACDATYAISWSHRSSSSVALSDPTPQGLQCDQEAAVLAPILAPDKTEFIKAVLTNVPKQPQDEARLIVDLADPKVIDQWPVPACTTACVNAEIGARFNVKMNGGDFLTPQNVQLFRCINAVCDSTENTQILLDSDHIKYDGSVAAPRLAIQNIPPETGSTTPLKPDTYYLVRLSGNLRADSNGARLSQSYEGSDSKTYANGYYFWTFRTQKSDQLCGIDHIAIEPDNALMSRVGEKQTLTAVPFGTVDACAPSGQRLDASAYAWKEWTAVDDPSKVDEPVHVVDMLSTSAVAGEIKIFPASRLPALCTSRCLQAGSSLKAGQAICGNGIVETGEDCDHGVTNGQPGDSCSSICLTVAQAACTLTCGETANACSLATAGTDCANVCADNGFCTMSVGVACDAARPCAPVACGVRASSLGCCGNGKKEGAEECDAGLSGSATCTAQCLNAGSSAFCGNEKLEPGEECDDGNTSNGDGCSSVCVNEGSLPIALAQSVCGNGNANQPGKECDDGNTADDDGCSSRCLFEGSSASYRVPSICGDGEPGTGEACDDGNTKDGDGCSSRCLLEGASASYDAPSFCGDGVVGLGESAACDPVTNTNGVVGPYGVSKIAANAPQEVDPATKTAKALVQTEAQGKIGKASVTLQCSCTTDLSCGSATSGNACGLANCCVPRPTLVSAEPTDGRTKLCRNTALSLTFSQAMNPESLTRDTLFLELAFVNGHVPTPAECLAQGGSSAVVSATGPGGLWSRFVNGVRRFFGVEDVQAQVPGRCLTPLTYEVNGTVVSLRYPKLLAANGVYRLVVVGDTTPGDAVKTGVLSQNLATLDGTLRGDANGNILASRFTVGEESDVCKIDIVRVEDKGKLNTFPPDDLSIGLFTKTGEQHTLFASARSIHNGVEESITPIPGVYAWEWNWRDNIADTDVAKNILTVTKNTGVGDHALAAAGKNNGQETVVGETKVTASSGSPLPALNTVVAGTITLNALLCSNPSLNAKPYKQDNTNFQFFYCRDAGEANSTSDDLPELLPATVPSPLRGVFSETLFKLNGTSDGLGVRVIANPGYLSPAAWYKGQKFTGTATPTTVDGYQAVQDGNTWYVSAPNLVGGKLYPNIYVISYNPNALASSKEAFNRILATWRFNANQEDVTDYNLCKKASGDGAFYARASGEYVSCTWERDCVDQCVNNTCSLSGQTNCRVDADCTAAGPLTCDAQKSKIRRDIQRLSDITVIKAAMDQFGSIAKHCSVTKTQRCLSDAQCGGNETCVSDVPTLDSGTFIRTLSVSNWPSWNAALGNAVGSALPNDPINAYYQCRADGFVADTCFNSAQSQFQCPEKSQVYAFQSTGGETYQLSARLEYSGTAWANPIDAASADNATIVVENAAVGSGAGFVVGTSFCAGSTVGTSNTCGDGVKGTGEECELGEVTATYGSNQRDACTVCVNSTTGAVGRECATQAECTTLGAGWACPGEPNGYRNVSCVKDAATQQCKWQVPSPAACIPARCGNGIKDTGEECDDGTRNGVYGSRCNIECKVRTGPSPAPGVSFCGDGYLAGGEQCDCGADQALFSQLDGTSWAKANGCTQPNGGYVASGLSCTFDCRAPGPSCGNGKVDGAEQCDGDTPEEYSGKLCTGLNIGAKCMTNADCNGGVCGGGTSDACPTNVRVCLNPANPLFPTICTSNAQCGVGGTCGTQTYTQVRVRSCVPPKDATGSMNANACTWTMDSDWTQCKFTQIASCGNSKLDPGEECDLGAGNGDNKACTSACKKNVCGDGLVNQGVESCDQGTQNTPPGQPGSCNAPYGGNCNYCTTACQYKTLTGDFCGDGEINGPEQCDGSKYLLACVKTSGTGSSRVYDRQGSCKPDDLNRVGDATFTGCNPGYTCMDLGICDGGDKNGASCTLATAATDCPGTGGRCALPTCAANCASSCPFAFQTASILIEPNNASSTQPQVSVDLYSTGQGVPDGGLLNMPACRVGSQFIADVDDSNVSAPSVDVVFVTDMSESMNRTPEGTNPSDPVRGKRRIDIVAASAKESIDRFAEELGPSGDIRVGAVSFGTWFKNLNAPGETSNPTGFRIDSPLVSITSGSGKTSVQAELLQYSDELATTNTSFAPMYVGVQKAVEMLNAPNRPGGPADVKVIVILSDGGVSNNKTAIGNTNSCSGYSYTFGGFTYSGDNACFAEIFMELVRPNYPVLNGGIRIYSAAISTNSNEIGRVAHVSSDMCGSTNAGVTVRSDCVPRGGLEYAFDGGTADAVRAMYQAITDSVLGTTISYSGGVSGGGSVTPGKGVAFPFPGGFSCQAQPFTVPFSISFNGEGTMKVENVKFSYCPVR